MLDLNRILNSHVNAEIGGNAKIFLADFSHKKELTELWIEAFGDDEKFVSSFLGAYMIPEYNVPVVVSGGKIVSALYLIEFELYSDTKVLGNCAYLFAACTKKEYRNKGFMSGLVSYSAELCANRGLKAVFLFPQGQNQKLFDFYSKLGFKTIYAAKKITNKSGAKKTKFDLSEFKLENKDITDVNIFDELYDSYVEFTAKQELAPMKDRLFYFKCVSSYLDSGVPENSKVKTYFAVFENNVEKFCYVFYKKYKNTYYIDDIILPKNNNNFTGTVEMLSDFILKSGENVNLGLNIPPSSFGGSQNVPLAMLLPLSCDVKNITDNLKAPVYINMFMNI